MRHKPIVKANGSDCAVGDVAVMKTGKGPIDTTISRLTAAENRVLALVTRAKTNKEIARALGISPATVKRHLENLLRKLQLKNRVAAAVYGLLVSGCAHGLDAGCALRAWFKEREVADTTWAD